MVRKEGAAWNWTNRQFELSIVEISGFHRGTLISWISEWQVRHRTCVAVLDALLLYTLPCWLMDLRVASPTPQMSCSCTTVHAPLLAYVHLEHVAVVAGLVFRVNVHVGVGLGVYGDGGVSRRGRGRCGRGGGGGAGAVPAKTMLLASARRRPHKRARFFQRGSNVPGTYLGCMRGPKVMPAMSGGTATAAVLGCGNRIAYVYAGLASVEPRTRPRQGTHPPTRMLRSRCRSRPD